MENRGNNLPKSNDFDYSTLQGDRRAIVRQRTEEIKERLKRSARDIWEIGQKLFEVRSQLAYGNFDSWLKAEFGWSRRTAYNFIKVYEAFPECATVAQVSIAASALYQLSSPSTPQKVRNELIQRAKEGEKITRKDISLALKSKDPAVRDTSDVRTPLVNSQQQVISVVSQDENSPDRGNKNQTPVAPSTEILDELKVSSGWHKLGEKHFLFYGDTASAQFHQAIPQVTLAIAVTSNDWDHDWLIDKAETLIVLQESSNENKPLDTLIALLSQPGDIVLFPWLPDENTIALAHRQNRIIIAGDPVLERCRKAVVNSKLALKAIASPQAS